MIQYDRPSGVFVLKEGLQSDAGASACAELNDAVTQIRAWLNLKRRNGTYSHGLLAELAVHYVRRTRDVHTIYDEIGRLEGHDPYPTRTKKSRCMRAPLQELWHKHYFQAGFMVHNLADEAERMVNDGRWERMFASHYGKYMHEIAGQIAHEFVIGAFEQRSRDRKLTGDFIVYAKRQDGSHYYLTLGSHGEWDAIRARVDEYRKFDSDGGW